MIFSENRFTLFGIVLQTRSHSRNLTEPADFWSAGPQVLKRQLVARKPASFISDWWRASSLPTHLA